MTACPYTYLTADISKAFRYRDLAQTRGGLPSELLNETESFLAAWSAIDAEESYWEKLKESKHG